MLTSVSLVQFSLCGPMTTSTYTSGSIFGRRKVHRPGVFLSVCFIVDRHHSVCITSRCSFNLLLKSFAWNLFFLTFRTSSRAYRFIPMISFTTTGMHFGSNLLLIWSTFEECTNYQVSDFERYTDLVRRSYRCFTRWWLFLIRLMISF